MPARLPALRGPVRPSHLWALATLSIVGLAALFPSPTNAAPTSGLFADASPSIGAPDVGNSEDEDYNRMVREAFARLADPVEPWGFAFAKGKAEPDTSWISHWFSMGGEGEVTVFLGDTNITFPHRPAAFPAIMTPNSLLPVNGTLVAFQNLPDPQPEPTDSGRRTGSGSSSNSIHSEAKEILRQQLSRPRSDLPPERACVPPTWPPLPNPNPKPPYVVALVERGDCDFATKVFAAQERGASAVIVGDGVAREGETDEEGRKRENLITMYSPEDTSRIWCPSVFVSRASYLNLRDMLNNHTKLRVEVGQSDDDGNALGSLLTFALLMPSLFLLATIAAHRVRIHRQREANRAPPTVVLSLPERVWTPDIVWEKDETDDSDGGGPDDEHGKPSQPEQTQQSTENHLERATSASTPVAADDIVPGTSGIVVETLPAEDAAVHPPHRRRGKERRKSQRYYSKDECAICMENFSRGEVVRILPCGHVFHKDECDEWLLKWRKLCPTCRADVTVSTGDMSGSTTLTPVVDAQANASGAAANADYGATGTVEAGAGEGPAGGSRFTWLGDLRDRAIARAGAAVTSVNVNLRAVFRGGGNRPAVALNERTPLRATDV